MATSTPSDPLSEIEGYLITGVFVALLGVAGWFVLPLLLPIISTAIERKAAGSGSVEASDEDQEAIEDEEESEEEPERVPL